MRKRRSQIIELNDYLDLPTVSADAIAWIIATGMLHRMAPRIMKLLVWDFRTLFDGAEKGIFSHNISRASGATEAVSTSGLLVSGALAALSKTDTI